MIFRFHMKMLIVIALIRDRDEECRSRSRVVSSQPKAQNQGEQVRDPIQWIQMTNETDERPANPINFTVRHPKSAQNIPDWCT